MVTVEMPEHVDQSINLLLKAMRATIESLLQEDAYDPTLIQEISNGVAQAATALITGIQLKNFPALQHHEAGAVAGQYLHKLIVNELGEDA